MALTESRKVLGYLARVMMVEALTEKSTGIDPTSGAMVLPEAEIARKTKKTKHEYASDEVTWLLIRCWWVANSTTFKTETPRESFTTEERTDYESVIALWTV